MHILVTGCAGFIGSHLVHELLGRGHTVTGVDCFTEYYERERKERNLGFVASADGFEFTERDVGALSSGDLRGVDAVVHLAAQPGVRLSWDSFDEYVRHNIAATKHLAALSVEAKIQKMVFASSSSVYGDSEDYPTTESSVLTPRSPYGVTKAAGEMLLRSYAANFGLTVLALRFFTVYGPGQRPDMATQRLIRAGLDGTGFTLLGDGLQERDFTYVADIVDACVRATELRGFAGFEPLNIGGSGTVSMLELIRVVEEATGQKIDVRQQAESAGDVRRTGADGAKALEVLGWRSRVQVPEGVGLQVGYETNPVLDRWVPASVPTR